MLLACGCGLSSAQAGRGGASGDADNPLTSHTGQPYQIDWDSFVYVAPNTPDSAIQSAIQLQIKSFLGAGRELQVEIQDRDAQHNLDPSKWVREPITVAGSGAALLRVRYHYTDTALVWSTESYGQSLDVTLLFGDYVSGASALIPICADDPTTEANSLWYHYTPSQPACQQAISTELSNITAASNGLAPNQIAQVDASRRFVPIRAKLTPQAAAPVKYPEYDRLFGFGSDRQKIIVYSFFGVEGDETSSSDEGIVEYLRFIRTLRAQWPQLQVTNTQPFAMLLDFYVNGQKLDGITYENVAQWMVDGTGYPAQVGSDPAAIEALKQQVRANFQERWIYWDVPLTISWAGQTRQMTLEVRTFQGCEDGTADCHQHAIWRYLEAFWYGDVFSYSGHSHFGYGPLDPQNYNAGNFPDRYQVMLINSCLSYNYYDADFLAMHPEGSKNLEVVMNGLPAYWNGMGESTAAYVIGLAGGQLSYGDLLASMAVPDPLGSATPYDPMRAVNGELDNVFAPTNAGPISVSVSP